MGFEPEKSRRQGGAVSGLGFCCEEGRNRGIVDGGILQWTGPGQHQAQRGDPGA